MTLVLGPGFKTECSARLLWKTVATPIMGPTCPFLKARNLKLHPAHKSRHVQVPLGVGCRLREQGPYGLRPSFFNGF